MNRRSDIYHGISAADLVRAADFAKALIAESCRICLDDDLPVSSESGLAVRGTREDGENVVVLVGREGLPAEIFVSDGLRERFAEWMEETVLMKEKEE